MMLQAGLRFLPRIGCIPNRSAATFKNKSPFIKTCPDKPTNSKSKNSVCPHTPKLPQVAADGQKKGCLSRLASVKKCPKVCSYMEKECPPLVPPIVRAKPKIDGAPQSTALRSPRAPRADVPLIAVWGYRLTVFGAKVGIVAYFIKWTIDNGIWDRDTSGLWQRWSSAVNRVVPQYNVLNGHSTAEIWNMGVYRSFDFVVDASRWVRRKVVEKEHEVYGPTSGEKKSLNLRSRLGVIGDRLMCGKVDEKDDLTADAIVPDTPEYYGVKPGSATEEMLSMLQDLQVPEFELEIIITEPSLYEAQTDEKAGEITAEAEGNAAEENVAEENVAEEHVAEQNLGSEEKENKVSLCPHQKGDCKNQNEIPPCQRSDCPMFTKTDENQTLEQEKESEEKMSSSG